MTIQSVSIFLDILFFSFRMFIRELMTSRTIISIAAFQVSFVRTPRRCIIILFCPFFVFLRVSSRIVAIARNIIISDLLIYVFSRSRSMTFDRRRILMIDRSISIELFVSFVASGFLSKVPFVGMMMASFGIPRTMTYLGLGGFGPPPIFIIFHVATIFPF